MTIAQATCATCGTPFARKRTAQRTCSTACKQALFRAEKCNAGHHDTEEPQDLAEAGATPALQRMYPGLKPLSNIECRVLRLEPAGLCDHAGALLYRRLETNDPATAPTVPGHGSINPEKETEMNTKTHTTRPASPPAPFKHADDEVSRAKAIITTVWLAMSSDSFDVEDIEALGDTVYEAIQRLSNAEKLLGVHHDR